MDFYPSAAGGVVSLLPRHPHAQAKRGDDSREQLKMCRLVDFPRTSEKAERWEAFSENSLKVTFEQLMV